MILKEQVTLEHIDDLYLVRLIYQALSKNGPYLRYFYRVYDNEVKYKQTKSRRLAERQYENRKKQKYDYSFKIELEVNKERTVTTLLKELIMFKINSINSITVQDYQDIKELITLSEKLALPKGFIDDIKNKFKEYKL